MPELGHLVETILVVDDVPSACAFYRDVLELEPLHPPDERSAMFVLPGPHLFGLLDREAARRDNDTPAGTIPRCLTAPREGPGGTHVAFAVPASSLESWRAHLSDLEVDVEAEVEWERGGTSLYFRDPEGSLVELVTPGVWDVY